jgi:hypothetical protein
VVPPEDAERANEPSLSGAQFLEWTPCPVCKIGRAIASRYYEDDPKNDGERIAGAPPARVERVYLTGGAPIPVGEVIYYADRVGTDVAESRVVGTAEDRRATGLDGVTLSVDENVLDALVELDQCFHVPLMSYQTLVVRARELFRAEDGPPVVDELDAGVASPCSNDDLPWPARDRSRSLARWIASLLLFLWNPRRYLWARRLACLVKVDVTDGEPLLSDEALAEFRRYIKYYHPEELGS